MEPIERRQKPPPSGPGWVYVLTCPDFPGCCKIGGTSRTPTHRAVELVVEYGTTGAFTVVARHATADWWIVEQTAHRMLSDRRLPRSELFRCSPAEASHVIEAAAKAYARPWSPAAWLPRLLFPPPRTYPAARSAYRPWHSGRRGWRRRSPLHVVVLLVVLIALWLAARHSSSPGLLSLLPDRAAGPGASVRVIYP